MTRMKTSKLVAGAVVLGLAAVAAVGLGSSASAKSSAAPTNTSPPTISGTGQEGQTIKASPGTWSGSTPIDYSFQWRRCGPAGGNCKNIAKATDNIYTLASDDVGHTLRVLVTAVNNDGAGTAQSKPTDVIKKAPAQAPRLEREPKISGTPQEGQTLTADAGTWTGTQPIDVSYRWRRCDAKGGDCTNTSVTSQTYQLANADVGRTVRVLVTASNRVGASAAISNASSVITSNGPAPGSCQSIAKVALPERLVIDQLKYNPSTITSRTAPVVARFHVVSTKGYCVSGATVYAAGVPFGRLTSQPETTTGADGWAQVTFQIRPNANLPHNSLLVLFVRARKAGDNVLAGISTRRLVSVRVA